MNISFLGPFGFHPNKTMRSRAFPLAQALVTRGHKVQLVMPPWQTPEEAGKRWRENGVDLIYVNLKGGVLPTVRRMVAAARAFDSQVIHGFKPKAHSGLAMWWLWQRQRFGSKKRLLVTDTDDWEGWGGWNDIAPYSTVQKYFFAWQERWGLTHNDLLTVASRALGQKSRRLGQPTDQILYLPNGSGISSAPVRLTEITAKKETLGLSNRPTVLLYSRLFEFDIARLTKILKQVHAKLPNLAILSIGTGLFGEDHHDLRQHFRRAGLLDLVIDLGWLEEEALPAAILAADVGLYLMDDTLLNRTKCPVKLADMISLGLPVVGERVGQVPEYVVSEENGLLRASGDIAGVATDLLNLLQNPGQRAAYGYSGRARWQQLFSWDRQAEKYEEKISITNG
ncbi:MAG: glycosyltransferase [Ardenticatenaceae bacterium]|nr:glycosyltransferase [Ardenticatenaceae bacterium]